MRKYKVLILMSFLLTAFIFPKDVTPVLSIRYDNLDDGISVSDAIGLKMNIDGNKFSGFDTDGTNYRIYVGWGFGKIGFGGNAGTDPTYTVGGTYGIMDNLDLDLDYVINPAAENIRLALNIHF